MTKWYRSIKFFFQRLFRGFDDSETWSLDSSLSRLILPRLKRYKELAAYQIAQTNEMKEAIDEMIYGFEWFASDRKYSSYEDSFKDELNRAQNGINLFAKHFGRLWW